MTYLMHNQLKYFYRLLLAVSILVSMNVDGGADENSGLVKKVSLVLKSDNVVLQVNRSDISDSIEFLNKLDYLDVLVDGYVICSEEATLVPENTEVYFGTYERALYGTRYPVHSQEWNNAAVQGETKYSSGPQVFRVPLENISNGHSTLRVDTNELMQKKLLNHLKTGEPLKNFYQNTHEITLSRTITLIAECESEGKRSFGYDTQNVNITVQYQGDPGYSNSKLIDRQLSNFNKSFLKLTDLSVFRSSLMYSGACDSQTTRPVKFSYTAVGKGDIRFILVQGGETIAGSEIITHNSEIEKTVHSEVLYPLGMQGFHKAGPGSFDEMSAYSFSIKAQIKEARGPQWGEWFDLAHEQFRYHCLSE
ncbi:hypothetical protein [Kiloniella litopenaei]|nr:hypothetical protein [Kiloniella litopenaei]